MKIITTISLLFFSILLTFGQKTEIGNKVGSTEFKQIKNGVCVNYDFIDQTKGKITIIEFWETWCGPCIEGMGHLKALQSKFPNSLKVVCVSSDRFDKTVEFITRNDFPFDFIYDGEKLLSEIFPHSGIPHTILIDKKGQINAQTYPGYVTEQILTELNNDHQVNLPTKKNFVPSQLRKDNNKNSLITFELQRHELGERNYIEETCNKDIPLQIITGYTGKAYFDTIETINGCVIAGKNALQIYQYAFDNIPTSRFIYDRNLNYLNSSLPNYRYKMNFSCSNLVGDFKEILINQLNSVWGLKTEIIEKEITYYELIDIDLKENKIVTVPNSTIKITGSTSQSFKELTTSNIYTAESIAALIEKQIVFLQDNKYWNQQDKKIYFPVTTNIKGEFALNISINDESSSVDKWIELLNENGLSLVKRKGEIKYIKIEKAAHNILYK
ncbi:TlpA disulfide reductase family protein [uncultured Sunxiuqinia sp.]|uniref:TlpA family protein disulfide reductase n=1 Tax=uncultured Sunxiuqinia sp. TaxID=1573825 RepID=UPI002AA87736|nr:TlpA disulfide reductase family protein [uncultured Sunxiuqinia sp.]